MKGLGNAEIFARNLKYYTEQSGKLGKDIAAVIGVTASAYSDWMNGKKYPRIDKIEKLANFFHIQKSDLIEDKSCTSAPQIPHTDEARILASGIDKMPETDRQKALDMMKLMFSEYADYFNQSDRKE